MKMCFNLLTLEDGAPPLVPVWTWLGTLAETPMFHLIQSRRDWPGKKKKKLKLKNSQKLVFSLHSTLYIKNLQFHKNRDCKRSPWNKSLYFSQNGSSSSSIFFPLAGFRWFCLCWRPTRRQKDSSVTGRCLFAAAAGKQSGCVWHHRRPGIRPRRTDPPASLGGGG